MDNTLELQLKTTGEETLKIINKLIDSMGSFEKTVSKSSSSIEKISNSVNSLDKATGNASKNANKLGKALTFAGIYTSVKRLTASFLNWMDQSVDFTEQLNLFNVVFKNVEKNGTKTFSELGKSATNFQYKLNETFGTNKTETLYMQGIFQSMGNTVGIPEKYSSLMSETMTKLTYDLASLYNKSEKSVAEALRAGVYAGQTKPLRTYGIDVTQGSLQPILDSLGIDDRSVKQMSQAERELLRYIATMKQAKIAMGDFANTIESPANQMKVFKQQLVEAKVALTSLFIGAFSAILPYVNAILMVIKEVSKAISTMFGIKLQDYNTGIASTADAYSDLSDNIGNATGKAKELKRQLLGFDEVHNIDDKKDAGSGSVMSGGIDQRLLDAIKGYDNGMENIRMKATQIRDNIMEWLGFTKQVDSVTGEVSFKLKDGLTRIEMIWTSIKFLFDTIVAYNVLKFLGSVNMAIAGTGTTGIAGGIMSVGKLIATVFGIEGAGALATFGIGLGTILGTAGLLYAVFGNIAGLNFEHQKGIVDWWGGASEETANRIGNVETATKELQSAIDMVTYKGMEMTAEEYSSILEKITSLKNGALTQLDDWYLQETTKLDELYSSEEDKQTESYKMQKETLKEKYNSGLNELSNYVDEYTKAFQKFYKNDKKIDFEERTELLDIQKKFDKWSIEHLSTTNKEKENLIKEYNDKSGYLIMKQAVDDLTAAKKNKDEEIKIAEEKYQKKLKQAEEYYSGDKEKYDKYIALAAAERQKEIDNAETSYTKFYDNWVQANSEIAKFIDRDTGTIFSNMIEQFDGVELAVEGIYNTINGKAGETTQEIVGFFEEMGNQIYDSVAQDKYHYEKTGERMYKGIKDGFLAAGKKSPIEIMADVKGQEGYASSKFGKIYPKADGGVFSNGSWKNIQQYANGGAPSHGTMFWAGEKGPEIVAHANGRTEVLNQSQIASTIYSAMTSAMSQYSGGTTQVELIAHTDEGVVIDRINTKTKQTGEFPLIMPN